AILIQYAPVTAAVLDALPQLKAVGRYGVGVDTVDVEAATSRGVAVCNVPDYGVQDVSDHAIALTMSVVRGTAQLDRLVRNGEYGLVPVKPLHRVSTLRFGVLGLGRIGAAAAARARALSCTGVASGALLAGATSTAGGGEVVAFETALRSSDVLCLQVPVLETTPRPFAEGALARMKAGSVLGNTCGAAVI